MKFGVSSYSFSKYIMQTKCDYFKICDIAKEIGYDGIEFINLDNKNWGITDDPIKTAGEIKEYCAKIGLDPAELEGKIVCLNTGMHRLFDDSKAYYHYAWVPA